MADVKDLMGFTRDEASRLADLSRRRLERIITTGVHDPEHSSGILSFRDLVSLRTIARLRNEFGVSLSALRRAYVHMQQYAKEPWSQLVVGVAPKKKIGFLNPETSKWEMADISQQVLAEFSIAEVEQEMVAKVKLSRQRQYDDIGKFDHRPGVLGNAECFKGTRIPKRVVLEYLKDGASTAEIIADYPSLTDGDIEAAKLAS